MRLKLKTASIPDMELQEGVKLSDDYDYIKYLGCGAFSFVAHVVDKKTGSQIALKVSY